MNIGEEVCESWLRHTKNCDFIDSKVKIPGGELDVIGMNSSLKRIYVCEASIHLISGLRYTANGKSNNIKKITAKFQRIIKYLKSKYNSYYTIELFFWSPVVKNGQNKDLKIVQNKIFGEFNIYIQLYTNGVFMDELNKLRVIASQYTPQF